MKRLVVTVSAALVCSAAGAQAAEEFVYVVNGTGASIQLMIDAQVFPPMAHLQALSVRATPGRHIIIAGEPKPIADDQIYPTGTSISPDLTANAGIVDEQKRTFWCFIVGKQSDGTLRIISPNRPTCAELIRRGVGSRPLK